MRKQQSFLEYFLVKLSIKWIQKRADEDKLVTGRDNRKRAKTDTWRLARSSEKFFLIHRIYLNKYWKIGSYLPTIKYDRQFWVVSINSLFASLGFYPVLSLKASFLPCLSLSPFGHLSSVPLVCSDNKKGIWISGRCQWVQNVIHGGDQTLKVKANWFFLLCLVFRHICLFWGRPRRNF